LERAGRVKARGGERDALTYRGERLALPEGVNAQALAAVWLAELQAPAGADPAGALFAPIENPCREEKCPTPPPPTAETLAVGPCCRRSLAAPIAPPSTGGPVCRRPGAPAVLPSALPAPPPPAPHPAGGGGGGGAGPGLIGMATVPAGPCS
jgi:hypothetical protein